MKVRYKFFEMIFMLHKKRKCITVLLYVLDDVFRYFIRYCFNNFPFRICHFMCLGILGKVG